MKNIFESNFSRNLSGICLVAAPLFLLMSSLMGIFSADLIYPRYVFGKAGMAAFVLAIFVIVQILRPEMEKLALIAGGMAIIGAISGTTLHSFIYYAAELKASGLDPAAMQTSDTLLKQVYLTMVFVPLPGLFFPIGLTVLSGGLWVKGIIPRPVAIILAVAAISFPFGRIPQNQMIVLITDSLFFVSMAIIAGQVFGFTLKQRKRLNYSNT